MTGNRVDEYIGQTFRRSGLEGLRGHLEERYGIEVTGLTELDVGVFRVDRGDGPAWVARVFPAARPVAAAEGDAGILRYLAGQGFPAERCARDPAVSVHEQQAVLVTEYLPGPKGAGGQQLGDLLGVLHTLPAGPGAVTGEGGPVTAEDGVVTGQDGAVTRAGGAWHHLAYAGGPRAELDAAVSLLDAARDRVPGGQADLHARLRGELDSADDGDGLPRALIHPDFVAANAITGPGGALTMIDWAGAGQGPRMWSLAFLLWAAGGRGLAGVDAVVAGYRAHVEPEPAELSRLAGMILARPLVLGSWAFCVGRRALPAVLDELPKLRARAEAIATRATRAFTQPSAGGSPGQPPAQSAPLLQEGAPGVGEGGRPAGVATTGVGVAAIRAAETRRPDRLFADPLAEAFVAASGWTPTAPPGDRRVARLRAWVVARTLFLDELLASACEDGCRQAVLLGAGLDARAFRLSWPAGVRCFELDTADVLGYKEQVIAAEAARPGCERIPIPCDLREDWPGALLDAGYHPGQPAAWIVEGVLVYLEPDDVDGLLADLSELSTPGSRLGLTMTGIPQAGSNGEPDRWYTTLRRSGAPEDPVGWLSGHGWRADQVSGAAEVLAAHGRPPSSGQPQPTSRRPGGMLIDATRDPR